MKNGQIQENLKPLMVFVGNWKVEGVNFAFAPNSPDVKVLGTQKVQLMEGGKFLKSDWKYDSKGDEHVGISIVGTDNDSKNPKMHNFDNIGFYRMYELKIEDTIWEIIGKTERATIIFDTKEASYNEKWEIKEDGKWKPLCERKAIKY